MSTGLSDLTQAQRIRIVGTTVLRALLRIALVLGLYAVLPLGRGEQRLWVTVALGLLAFGALVGWEAYAVLTAPRPVLRAAQSLAVAVPLFIVFFSVLYYEIEDYSPGSMSEPLSKIDALYLTVTVAATVGFGDITPVSSTARLLATVNMVGNLAVLGASVRLLTSAAKQRHVHDEPAV